MSNRFGINTATNAGDGNNPQLANASETETEATPKPVSGLNFNSVVSSSFNDALTNADQMLKTEAAKPKPDNSTFLSASTSLVSGFGGGLWDQVNSVFKKDKATLAREADLGSVASLEAGHSVSASLSRTAGDVAHAAPALNPFSEQGRKNLGTLSNKWVEGWTTGTFDDKMRFAGNNLSFVATLGAGTSLTTKGTSAIVRDIRGGTIANRALSLSENVALSEGRVMTVGRQFLTTADDAAKIGSHGFAQEGTTAATITESVGIGRRFVAGADNLAQQGVKLADNLGQRGLQTADNLGQRVVNLTDRIGVTGPTAGTFGLRTTELAAQDGNLFKNLAGFYREARPATFTSTAITDASKVAAKTATTEFTEAVTRLLPEGTSLTKVQKAAEALVHGGPEARTAFIDAIKASTTQAGEHANELSAFGNRLLNSVERSTSIERFGLTVDKSVTDIGTKLETLNTGLAKTSEEAKLLQRIKVLADDVARGGSKSDELVNAVKALEHNPTLNPQLVKELAADAAKLETASTGRRLLTTLESSVSEVGETIGNLTKNTKLEGVFEGAVQKPGPAFDKLQEVSTAAKQFANGAISQEQFAAKVNELKQFAEIPPNLMKAITQDATQLTERVNATSFLTHMDDMVKPIKSATQELDNVLAPLKATSPEHVAKVEQALADFVAGRSGNTEELTAALRNLANNERKVATTAGGDAANVTERLANVTRVSEELSSKSGQVVEAVEKARPALTLERSIAETTPVLEEAARRWASNPQQLKAVREVQEAFEGAIKGRVSSDELVQVINKNSRTLERAVEGSTQTLTVNGTRIADAAVDTTRALSIKTGVADIAKASDEVVNTVKALQTQFAGDGAKVKSLQQLEEAVTAFKTAPKATDELTVNLQKALQEVKQAGVPFEKHMDEFANTVERTSTLQALETSVVKTRQATNNITAATDLMEAAVRQGEQFQAIDRLKTAVRSGKPEEISNAFKQSQNGLAELERLQPGSTKQIVADIAKAEAGDTKALTRLTQSLDNAETVAKRTSSEFRALEEVRAAARTAARDGVADDLANVIKKNESQLVSMQEKVTAMEAKVAGTEAKIAGAEVKVAGAEVKAAGVERVATTETKATNLVERLNNEAKVLGDETTKIRQLTNTENASRSLNSAVENIATKIEKIDDPARQAAMMSKQGGTQLAKDVRELAETVGDATTKRNLIAKAEQLEQNAGQFNHVSERLNVIKSITDDVARGSVRESEVASFIKKSSTHLDEVGKGTGALVESKVAAVADARTLVVARESIDTARKLPNFADEATKLGFKADSQVGKLATEYNTALRAFTHENGTIADVNAAAQKLREFKPVTALGETEARNLQALVGKDQLLDKMQKSAQAMDEARAAAFQTQWKAYAEASRANNVSTFTTALNHIGNMYDVMPPVVQRDLLRLREDILNRWAGQIVHDLGYNGTKTLAQREFGNAAGGRTLLANIEATSSKYKIAQDQVKDAVERFNNIISENQVKYSVRGLTQDRATLLANPNLAQEAMTRQLQKDILKTAAGVGILYVGGSALKQKAEDYLYDQLNAPYKIAALMEQEIAAKTEADRQAVRERLTTAVADYIRGKDQSEIDELREQVKKIISERTAQNPEAQAVWSRRQEALTIGQIKAKKDYDNQKQYGNAHGPNRGPGTPSTAAESSQTVYVAPPARVRATSVSSIDEAANKRKPATTNFDINKIKDMSNNIAYSQSGLRSNPYGTGPASLASAYTPGSTKSWQNVVSWNTGRKLTTGDPSGKHVYGNFSHMEDHPENDQPGFGGGAVAQTGGQGQNDPAALALAAAAQQKAAQANQDEDNQSTTV